MLVGQNNQSGLWAPHSQNVFCGVAKVTSRTMTVTLIIMQQQCCADLNLLDISLFFAADLLLCTVLSYSSIPSNALIR